ncbi:MAG: DUF222 domain-containing protein [Nocardioidaceae bacterium]|nr:DUF222 domain-containing protein [Nocardioidaceae bacterium]
MEALENALPRLSETPAAGQVCVDGERIRRLLDARARFDAVVLDELAAFDAAAGYGGEGAPSAASWLRASARLGRRDASGLVHQARELRHLPVTARALAAGTITAAHVSEIVKAKKRSCLTTDGFGRYETILVELATQASPDEVRAAAAHLVEAEAPDRDKQLLEALADRSFTIRPVGDLVQVDATIDKVTAEALAKGVEALSRPTPGDDRSWHVRRADAFSELVMLGIDSGRVPQQGRVRPHVNLTMTLEQLQGIDGTGPLLQRFGQVPLRTAQRLACDAVMTRFVTDHHGEVLDVGRSCRLTNSALNKAIGLMYDVCAYPNCSTPITQCDIHHVWWWSRGGPTDEWNLMPLCKHHHLFVHEYGYFVLTGLDTDGTPLRGPTRWRFAAPTGRPIPDHRSTLSHYLEQLTLVPDPADTG